MTTTPLPVSSPDQGPSAPCPGPPAPGLLAPLLICAQRPGVPLTCNTSQHSSSRYTGASSCRKSHKCSLLLCSTPCTPAMSRSYYLSDLPHNIASSLSFLYSVSFSHSSFLLGALPPPVCPPWTLTPLCCLCRLLRSVWHLLRSSFVLSSSALYLVQAFGLNTRLPYSRGGWVPIE